MYNDLFPVLKYWTELLNVFRLFQLVIRVQCQCSPDHLCLTFFLYRENNMQHWNHHSLFISSDKMAPFCFSNLRNFIYTF